MASRPPSLVRLLPAVATLALLLAPSPTAALTSAGAGGAYVASARGTPVSTLMASEPGVFYTLAVTGMYDYNGFLGLADGCHIGDGSNPLVWYPGSPLRIDGAPPASCPPFSPAHTYLLEVTGTGRPLTFHIRDSFYGDNVGALVVAVFPPI